MYINLGTPSDPKNGKIFQFWNVFGANSVDWEALGYAVNARGQFLYIGDIADLTSSPTGLQCSGQNGARDKITLYEVAEPLIDINCISGLCTNPSTVVVNRRLDYTYPTAAERSDAEGLVIVPNPTGQFNDFYIFTKLFTLCTKVYRGNTASGGQLTFIGNMTSQVTQACGITWGVTDGTISSDGQRIFLRSTSCGWEWIKGAGETLDQMLLRAPNHELCMAAADVQAPREGEAATYVYGNTTTYPIIETPEMRCNCDSSTMPPCSPAAGFCPFSSVWNPGPGCTSTSCAPISKIECTR